MDYMSGGVVFKREEDIELNFESCKRKFAMKHGKEQPSEVKAVPQLIKDLEALEVLF